MEVTLYPERHRLTAVKQAASLSASHLPRSRLPPLEACLPNHQNALSRLSYPPHAILLLALACLRLNPHRSLLGHPESRRGQTVCRTDDRRTREGELEKKTWTITKASNPFEMSARTLSRYITAMKEVDVEQDLPPSSVGYSSRKVSILEHLFLVWLVDE